MGKYSYKKADTSGFDRQYIKNYNQNLEDIGNDMLDLSNGLSRHKTADHAHTSDQIDHSGFSLRTYIDGLYNRIKNLILNADGTNVKEVVDARVDADGNVEPLLKERLDKEYYKLLRKIQRNVNVDDYGADPTGETDSTDAFVRALGNGKVRLNLSAGEYVIKALNSHHGRILSVKEKALLRLSYTKIRQPVSGLLRTLTTQEETGIST